ncbi:MAG: DUF192 domain-containing protein [Acidimicrobiales bacterium]
MPWLVAGDRVVASLEVADTARARRRGLLGRDGIEGALLLTPARSVHTIRMRFAIDVAHLDDDMTVLSVVTMAPWRVGRWHRRARHVLEAEAGTMRHWGIEPGMQIDVRS